MDLRAYLMKPPPTLDVEHFYRVGEKWALKQEQAILMTQTQLEQMREIDFREMVNDLVKPGYQIKEALTTSQCHLVHMVLGISGEAGELLDAIKKHAIYGKDLDMENVQEECGDILFYLTGLLEALGISLDQCRAATMEKLAKRYPERKYTNQAAIERADKCS